MHLPVKLPVSSRVQFVENRYVVDDIEVSVQEGVQIPLALIALAQGYALVPGHLRCLTLAHDHGELCLDAFLFAFTLK